MKRLINIIKMLLKKLIDFLKKKLGNTLRMWILGGVAVLFVVFVVLCLAIWYFINR